VKTIALVVVALGIAALSYVFSVRSGDALLSRAEVEALERIPVLGEHEV
jgi:hypothetical protein